jgi:hypothetical protein
VRNKGTFRIEVRSKGALKIEVHNKRILGSKKKENKAGE